MIFILDARVADLESLPVSQVENLFSALMDADRSGRHLVVIDRSICSWAIKNVSLSGENSKHLVGLREQFATRGNITEYAHSFLKVVLGSRPVTINGDHFEIGHVEFTSGEYATSKTKMIVENLTTDSRLYDYLLGVAISQTVVPGFAVDFVLGGGDTTVTAFEAEVDKQRIAVCVVDTDRVSPCDNLGETARKVINSHAKRNLDITHPAPAYVGTVLETVGHELENYIPFSAVNLIGVFTHDTCLDAIVTQNSAADAADCFWRYFDTKGGIDGRKIGSKVAAGKKPPSVVDWICKETGISVGDFVSLRISGIGSSVADHFLKSAAAKTHYVEFSKSEYWRALFLRHFEQVLWFLAAPEIRRS